MLRSGSGRANGAVGEVLLLVHFPRHIIVIARLAAILNSISASFSTQCAFAEGPIFHHREENRH
jgi:hypothetical protein